MPLPTPPVTTPLLEYVMLDPTQQVAVMLHGVYGTASEADRAAAVLLSEDEEQRVLACVVDMTGAWRPLVKVDQPGDLASFAWEISDVEAPENTAGEGRAGSVCTLPGLNRSAVPGVEIAAPSHPTPSDSGAPRKTAQERRSMRAHYENQRAQLEDVLTIDPDGMPYPELRAMAALCQAFRRKLQGLVAKAEATLSGNRATIAELDAAHPEHHTNYLANYEEALAESGFTPEQVPLYQYL